MKIIHLANWNSTNIGNGALIYGTQRLLEEDIPGVEFIPEAWDDYTFKRKRFDQSFVDLVNEHDALLVNGAVTFNAFRRGNVHTGMRFDLPLPLWDKIHKPIILYGLSYRCWPFQRYPNKEVFTAWLKYVVSHERIFFGVRNDGTKEWIRDRFGIASERIYEVPDPGMFVPSERHTYPELTPDRKSIFLAFNGEDALYRYATPFDRFLVRIGERLTIPTRVERAVKRISGYKKVRRRVTASIARAVEQIAKTHNDVQFVLVPHYLDDYGMIQEFIEEVQERIAHQMVVSTGLVSVAHTGYFYGRYAQASLVIAMRVHSMSPSIGLGVPVIPLTSQGRMRNYLGKIGLSDIAVDISEDEFASKLVARAEILLAQPEELLTKTRDATSTVREQAKTINERIKVLLNA